MKTTYNAPETKVVTVEIQQMICTSPGIQEDTANTESTQEGGGYMLGRESNSIWDDEE